VIEPMELVRPQAQVPASIGASLDELLGRYREDVRAAPRPARFLRAVARFVRIVVTSLVLTVFTGLLVALTVPALFGYKNLIVMSGSMEPRIHTADVVIVKQISPIDAKVGDVVTFKDPTEDRLISHRVRSMHVSDGMVHFETKGDANNDVQKWEVPSNGNIGRVDYHLYKLGYILFWIERPWGRIVLVVVPALLLGAVEIKRIWQPKRKEPEDDAEAA
jgi:signal peptidase